jgi:DNA-binding beta-propeller fold protein YncE
MKFDLILKINVMKKSSLILNCILLMVCSLSLSGQSNYKIDRKISLPGEGFWDYITVDEVNGKIYQSHNSIAQVVDIKTGKVVGTIPDTKGIHGVAVAQELNKGFTSNGRDSSVTVFDLKTLAIITKIRVTGENPDAILYDAFSKRVFTGNGRSKSFTVIDAVKNTVAGTIQLKGKPEAIVTDGKGKIYVNIEDAGLIEMINAVSMKVEAIWPIGPGEEPSGLALDNQNHRLFSVCGNKLMMVIDAASGKVITSLPIGDGCDGAAFDPQFKRVYASNGEGTLTVVQVENANSFRVLETVPTQRGARTIALDKTSHHIYLPTAEFEAAPAGSNQRPGIKPNSFVILDLETLN